jgi:hypothetical protein
LNDLLQSVMDWTDQHFSSPLRTKDYVVHNQMDCMALVCIFHVDTIAYNNRISKRQRDRARRRGLFIPALFKPGMKSPFSVTVPAPNTNTENERFEQMRLIGRANRIHHVAERNMLFLRELSPAPRLRCAKAPSVFTQSQATHQRHSIQNSTDSPQNTAAFRRANSANVVG